MNTLYDNIRQQFLTGNLNWAASDIRCVLVSGGYDFDPNHITLDAIDPLFRIGDADIPAEAAIDGFAQGDPAIFPSLSSTELVVSAVLYVATGDDATSQLVAYYDEVVGFPFTPAGLDYYIAPDIVFGGFFRL